MKYRVGDKVLIKNEITYGMDIEGRMDKWLGKIMTVRSTEKVGDFEPKYYMEEDIDEWNGNWQRGWCWYESHIQGKIIGNKLVKE